MKGSGVLVYPDRHEHYLLVLRVLQIGEGGQAGAVGVRDMSCLCVCVSARKVFQTWFCRGMIGGVGWMWW